MNPYILAAPLAFLVGISLGLLGGGGSILAVPIFVYVLSVPPKSAIASSLLVVGLTSLVGALRHGARGHVDLRSAFVFGGAGVVGASVGSRVAALQVVPGSVLILVFAALMITVATLLLRGPRSNSAGSLPAGLETDETRRVPRVRLGATGLLTGMLTGLLGAGGGFIIVPSLLLVGRLPVRTAIGTSLLVIALNCGAGILGFLGKVPIRWSLGFAFATASIAGILVGAGIAARTRPARLRKGFAIFVLLAGVAILIERGGEILRSGP